ncbi:MAG: T9SS type A sorting domain-containing protein [Bacteroidia bacterium]|nr:T9SS type A sorting domain-containing protein [Bacteroidia bacterium]
MKKILFTGLSALLFGASVAQTPFFERTCYRGAFAPAPTPMWTDNWTEWDPQNKVYPAPTVTVTGNITTNTTWTSGQVVLLSAQCFIKNNSVLTIQPGVIVLGDKAATGAGIFVTKGSQIIANGTASSPIVFTSNQAPGQRSAGDWGGLVLLGKSTNNNSNGISNIEGLPISADTEFGGGANPDANDNSGSLKYVRLEFCGYTYQPNQEINSLTMGSVGKGTTIDYVQVSFGNDDAFEWFGGTVDCKHLVSFRNLDDDFDTDLGFSGRIQFALAVRDPQIADNPSVSTSEIFESDNDPTGTAATPKTSAIFSNVTGIGPRRGQASPTVASGHRRGLRIRRNSELKVFNSIFMDNQTRGLFIDGSACENNANAGTLKFKNNILAGYGQRATESGTFGIINTNTFVAANANDTLPSAANILVTPYNYTSPDYRPAAGSIALSNVSFTDAAISSISGNTSVALATIASNSVCIGDAGNITSYTFAPSTTVSAGYCSLNWSASAGLSISNATVQTPNFTVSTVGVHTATLSVLNGDATQTSVITITTFTCENVGINEFNNSISNVVLFPNPATNNTSVQFNASKANQLTIELFDISGKLVNRVASKMNLQIGNNDVVINTNDLENGIYFVTLSTDSANQTLKLVVQH